MEEFSANHIGSKKNMRAATIPLLCIVVTAACMLIPSQLAVSKTEQDVNADEKLNKLLAERRDTRRAITALVLALYREGDGTLGDVVRARNELLEAELEIAKTVAERIQIREQQVENLRELENALMIRQKSKAVSRSEVLHIKAERLEAEIQLLRE